tara:strand:+ start:646 stop:1005 length:360 start_codon:yes stop_codon:yes gene_type:complete
MLIKFTDDYVDEIFAAIELIGAIQCTISKKEPYVGNTPALDKLYGYSVLLSGIVDHLTCDDNSNPAENESLLLCLRSLIASNLCLPGCYGTIDKKNYHVTSPIPVRPVATGDEKPITQI